MPTLRAQQRAGGAAELGELVAGLGVTARVLVIGAHPDDEDTRIIAWLARGRHVETAYLSLTRGDGGQNLIGNELGEALGVIRTEELLAARRIDGAHQYFTRAYDFGFSKNAEEAFRHWPHDSLMNDVVTVVRAFRPQVIISIFSGTPQDGHGQHQVSGLLAREAYDAATDTVKYPVSKFGAGWTVSKFYRSSFFSRGTATLCFNVGEYSPMYGESYAEMAAVSRSQHKSQAMGQLTRKGAQDDCVRREAMRVTAAEDPKQEKSIFDGIDTTWARLRPFVTEAKARAALDSLPAAIAEVRRSYDPFRPSASLQPIALAERLLGDADAKSNGGASDAHWSIVIVRARANRALGLAAGVVEEVTVDRDIVARGDSIQLTMTTFNRGAVPVFGRQAIPPDSSATDREKFSTAGSTITQPWWLEKPRVGDLFGVPISGVPEDLRGNSGPAIIASLRLGSADGPMLGLSATPVHRYADPVKGEINHPLAIAPAVSVTFPQETEYAPANMPIDREIHVQLRSASTASRSVKVTLQLPKGLTADSASRTIVLPSYGAQRSADFRIVGRLPKGEHHIAAVAESNGERFSVGYVPIEYDHIRPQRLYRNAAITVQAVDVKLPPRLTVAYINGVGDNIAPALQQLGLNVTVIDPAKLPNTDLSKFSTIVVGTRAYESSPELVANNARLLDYVKKGGTMVVQYGQYEMQQPGMMPYPITLGRPADRVTDEDSPVSILKPNHPLMAGPNKVTPQDFEGWIQDRTLYMPRTFATEYVPLLSTHDPGEAANDGAILVTPYGSGAYVYTTLAFFRQLPAGVPGAARIFVNLLGAKGAGGAPVVP
ncbi:MAG: PIG-L family deacetylase [Gemmatimonadota bacterium]|nr:PIG-L family deacetylase [Gemmatimonadota bacterium]